MDSTTRSATPRSIAQFLEARIAEMDRQAAETSPTSSSDLDNRRSANNSMNEIVNEFTPSFLGILQAVPLARCIVAETGVPSARKLFGGFRMNDINEQHPRSIVNPQPTTIRVTTIPVHVADFLFEIYTTRVVPQHPIFYLPDLIAMEKKIFHKEPSSNLADEGTPYEIYVLSLIMAIALSTAARTKQAHANSIATGLFKSAMSYAPAVLSNDLGGLQGLLLLVQYAFLNPAYINLWLLTGMSSQACIDLGLHQEFPDDARISFLERDMRRRVFWCAWEMEVAVCAGLLRPISILQKHITCIFPSEIEDCSISKRGVYLNGRATKFTSHYIWQFRQIECDIISVLFHNEPLPASHQTLESWMSFQETQILDWKTAVHGAALRNELEEMQSQWCEMMLYSTIATDYVIVTLFRPCPAIKEPSSRNLIKAFAAAPGVASGYWQQANSDLGNSKYVFHPCHHSFSAALVFLQALQRWKAEISILYSLETIKGYMAEFSQFFVMVAERWPAASGCLDEWGKLLAPVKKEYIEFLNDKVRRESQVTLEGLADLMEIGPTGSLEDALNFDILNLINTGTDNLLSYHSNVPADWNTEFGFGMDAIVPL